MKPTLASIFSNASQDCQKANPQLGLIPKPKSKLQGNVERKRGASYETHNRSQLPNAELEPNKATALGATVQGKAKSLSRITVRFTGYRCRPLDPDNFAGSCKDLLDGLVHAGLLHGDEAWRIRLQTEQEKVSAYAQERMLIEIDSI